MTAVMDGIEGIDGIDGRGSDQEVTAGIGNGGRSLASLTSTAAFRAYAIGSV